MQRYEPTSGMIVTVQGGAYVRYADAQAEIDRLKADCERKDAENKALREFVEAVKGVCDMYSLSANGNTQQILNDLNCELAKLDKGEPCEE